MKGVEPPRPKARPPEDRVSTNFTTCAKWNAKVMVMNDYVNNSASNI